MDASHWIVALVGVVVGAGPALGKMLLDILRGRSAITLDERRALFEEAQKIRADLMTDVVTLRERVIVLQDTNLKLAVENAELRGTLRGKEEEIKQLEERFLPPPKDAT